MKLAVQQLEKRVKFGYPVSQYNVYVNAQKDRLRQDIIYPCDFNPSLLL